MDSVRRAIARQLAVLLMVAIASPALTARGLQFPRSAKDLMDEVKTRGRLPQFDGKLLPGGWDGKSQLATHVHSPTTRQSVAYPDTILVFSIEDTTRHRCLYNGALAGNDLVMDLVEKLTPRGWELTSRYTFTSVHTATSGTYVYLTDTWHDAELETVRTIVVIVSDGTHYYRTETREVGVNGELRNDFRQLDSSDYEGLNTIRVTQNWQDERWLNETRWSTTSDSTKTRLATLSQNWEGGTWVNVRRATQDYGAAWPDWSYTMTSELDEVWLDAEWVADYRVTCTNQSVPRIHQETSEQCVNGTWSKASRVTSFLDDQRRETAREYEIWNTSEWTYYWRLTWSYAPGGAIGCTSTFHAENGSWIEDDRTTSSYDGDGHLTGVLLQRNGAGQLANVDRYSYTYDIYGRSLEGSHDIAVSGAWFPWDGDFAFEAANNFQLHGYHFSMMYAQDHPASAVQNEGGIEQFSLSQNYPNPFNPKTVVSFQLPVASHVVLTVYDLLGREVAVLVNGQNAPGSYEATFDGSGLASGVYIYRLQAGNFVVSKRLILLK